MIGPRAHQGRRRRHQAGRICQRYGFRPSGFGQELLLPWPGGSLPDHGGAVPRTELDARIGDGDHGINLGRGMTAVRARVLEAGVGLGAAPLELGDSGATLGPELVR